MNDKERKKRKRLKKLKQDLNGKYGKLGDPGPEDKISGKPATPVLKSQCQSRLGGEVSGDARRKTYGDPLRRGNLAWLRAVVEDVLPDGTIRLRGLASVVGVRLADEGLSWRR